MLAHKIALQHERGKLLNNAPQLKPWQSRDSLAFQLQSIDTQVREYQLLISSNDLKLRQLRNENVHGVCPIIQWAETINHVYLRICYPNVKDQKITFEDDKTCLVTCIAGEGQRLCRLKLELTKKVNLMATKVDIGDTVINCILSKEERKLWRTLVEDERTDCYLIQFKGEDWISQFC
ncbi:hypothetical protein H5410_058731, partial [Solanum commersonii]